MTSCDKGRVMTVAQGENQESKWCPKVPASDSATQRMLINRQKISLLSTLNEVLKERRSVEHRRNTLLQSAAYRQHQVYELNFKCNASWQEKILEAQTLGKKWETQCASLRERREALHKQMLTALEGCVPAKSSHDTPSIRANYKMQAVQLQRDIAELKRRANNAKFRLDEEIKTRDTLQLDVKKLRQEVGLKKVHMASIRPQTLAMVSHPAQCRPAREHFRATAFKKRSTGTRAQ